MTMTTTKNGIRVEDITFKNARKQSAIIDELPEEDREISAENLAPVSMTPEQVKSFFNVKKEQTHNGNEKRLYDTVCEWIDSYFALKKQVILLEKKLDVYENVENQNTTDDNEIKED